MYPRVEMMIVLNPDGKVSVTGPLENKVICFGLLEMATKAVHDYAIPEKSLIHEAKVLPGGPFGPIRQ